MGVYINDLLRTGIFVENSDSTPQKGSPKSIAGSTTAVNDLALGKDEEDGRSGDGGEYMGCLSFFIGRLHFEANWRKLAILLRDPWQLSLYFRQRSRNLWQRYLAVQGIGRAVKT